MQESKGSSFASALLVDRVARPQALWLAWALAYVLKVVVLSERKVVERGSRLRDREPCSPNPDCRRIHPIECQKVT